MNWNEYSIVHWFDDVEPHRCGYCKNENCSISNGMWAEKLLCEDYQNLIDRGWRRSGKYLYKPIMNRTCCPQYTIRCHALNLKMSKSQKKIMKRFNKFLGDGILKKDTLYDNAENGDHGDPSQVFIPKMPNSMDIDYDKLSKVSSEHSGTTFNLNQSGDGSTYTQSTKPANMAPKALETTENAKRKNCQLLASSVKKGEGADPSKPPCKKAKTLRLERKQQKLQEQGKTLEKVQNNTEKSLEEFLNDMPTELKHKLRMTLVPTSKPGEQWKQVMNIEFELYKKYQTTIHSDKCHSVSMKSFTKFLVNSPLEIKCEVVNQEHEFYDTIYKLYAKYQRIIHNDAPSDCDETSFREFLVDTPLKPELFPGEWDLGYGSYHQQYWLDDELIAVGVIDILPRCVSSVYFFYDPDYRNLTLGTYGSLREIEFVRSLNTKIPSIQHYYMGFYIHSCPKMRYKCKMAPSDLVCPETYAWIPLEKCISKLDVAKYSRLNDDVDAIDEICCSQSELDNLKVLRNYRIVRYSQFSSKSRDAKRFELIGKLIGKKCLPRVLVVFQTN